MSFEKKLKRLGHRDWRQLSIDLLEHAGQLVLAKPGQAPAFHLVNFPGLGGIVQNIPRDGEYREQGISGFRSALLHEGIFLLHKCANVLVACHDQVDSGLPTWSLPTGYQAAFFAAEGILRILGIAIVEVNNIACSIDAWPQPEDSLKGKARAQYKIGSEVQFIRHDRIQHFHRWSVLQRILRTTSNHGLDPDICAAILAIDEKDFARQRNYLHYETGWKFDDLHSYYSKPGFFSAADKNEFITSLNPDSDEFSVALATVLLSFGMTFLRTLAELSNTVDTERKLLSTACTLPRMKLRAAFEGSGAGTLG